ncbi:hypothetical protein [Lactobacillus intestinalis]|uniref:Uncharacterized protein n=1 Tax=Lactobacillus intestinalis TaxID=151781 RepID=A0A4S2BSN4_9LACO|nr:hypothetical protein [Lactobacillus intestinalis]KAI4309870.1 hypothetical protein C821_001596 [Lactobacillus intestinalis]TGY17573.1 hypothetical protein E5351_00235 [Lactobacillus intestinalis]
MKRRIRKKMLQKEIYLINESLVRNSYLVDKYKNDRTMNGVIARLALPISNVGLKFRKSLLIKKIKRGDY